MAGGSLTVHETQKTVPICGLAISGFRSFGTSTQQFAPLGQINIFIGQNNCGKSNVLRLIERYYSLQKDPSKGKFLPSDYSKSGPSSIKLTFYAKPELMAAVANRVEQSDLDAGRKLIFSERVLPLLERMVFTYGGAEAGRPDDDYIQSLIDAVTREPEGFWARLSMSIVGQSSSDVRENVRALVNRLRQQLMPQCPLVLKIPALRGLEEKEKLTQSPAELLKILKGESGTGVVTLDGASITSLLHITQAPIDADSVLEEDHRKVVKFVQDLFEDPVAEIRVAHDKSEIQVTLNGRRLPVTELGTGVQEAILFGIAATVIKDRVLLIEEPEIHMHPTLQRRLVNYLRTTSNQYFIATHSAHFIDIEGMTVFHLRLENDQTIVTPVTGSLTRATVCSDLGYRASDIVQANCVIWVEGPSDRIYLRHWIGLKDPELKEGIHYLFLPYGGSLCSHLTCLDPDDPDFQDFISVVRLNRNPALVLDSDLASRDASLKDTKERLKKELEGKNAHLWITEGREIENYIPLALWAEIVKAVHPRSVWVTTDDQAFGDFNKRKTDKIRDVDKVSVAREFVKRDNLAGPDEPETDWDLLKLGEAVQGLVNFVRRANGYPTLKETKST